MLPVLALLALTTLPAAAAEEPLNIVVIDICSARADHFGAYGYQRPTTPKIDAVAKESALFENTMAQGSWCLPNFATLMTGHTAEVHGLYANDPFRPLPAFEKTVAERFRESGYRTGAFTGGIYTMKPWGLDRGFDRWENLFSTASHRPAGLGELMPMIESFVSSGDKKPFFLYATVDDLHSPYQSEDPLRFASSYDGIATDTDTLTVPFFRAFNGERLEPSDPLYAKVERFRKDKRAIGHLTDLYDAALAGADDKVGRLVADLKRRGLWERSVVIITADHGEMLGEQGLLGHTESLYEGVTRVPLLIHHPRKPAAAGTRVKALVQRTDLAPTLLDSVGIAYDANDFQGSSLMPLLGKDRPNWRTTGYASSRRNIPRTDPPEIEERVLRSGQYKLHWYSYKSRYELYDLATDPLETRDIARENPEAVSRLSFELLQAVEKNRPHAPGPVHERPRSVLVPQTQR